MTLDAASARFAEILIDDLHTLLRPSQTNGAIDQTAGVNLAIGTWHWGPYPIGDRVDLINLQGADFEHDNDIAYLERDLGAVVEVRL